MHQPPQPLNQQRTTSGPVCDHCGSGHSADGWRAFADGAQVCAACHAELDAPPQRPAPITLRSRAAA